MNTPNKLTLFRILMVMPFISILIIAVWFYKHNNLIIFKWSLFSSGIVFVIAMITDFIDGFLARKNNQVTDFGKLFDPLADKFITTTALIFLSILGIMPIYFLLLFILRDLLVDGSRNIAARKNVKIAASKIGKIKTMLMSIGITIIFFTIPFIYSNISNIKFDFINPSWQVFVLISPIMIASILSTISGVLYFKLIIPYINTK